MARYLDELAVQELFAFLNAFGQRLDVNGWSGFLFFVEVACDGGEVYFTDSQEADGRAHSCGRHLFGQKSHF